jgi:glutamate 5-kinase
MQDAGRLNTRRIRTLVRSIAGLKHSGKEVVFVTSGAIGAGMSALGLTHRPNQLPELQMAAAIGQSRLMTRYGRLFGLENCLIGQVLLTHDDLKQRTRHLNARNTMMTMLRTGIIPVVNENDVVSVDEIRFGDNDLLASLVVHLVSADLLILLTTTDGLREFYASGHSRRIPVVPAITSEITALARGKGGELSSGGMITKLESARAVTRMGAMVVIADGRKVGVLEAIMAGHDTGTLILPTSNGVGENLNHRKRWIAFFHKPQGVLTIDDGACRAVARQHRSLLPIGVKAVTGEFPAGAAVDVRTTDQILIARGLVSYSSHDLRRIMGQHSDALPDILGAAHYEEAIHRDNLVLLN